MSINIKELNTLITILGRKGTVSGLQDSDITNAKLIELGKILGASITTKTKRDKIITELVNADTKRISKTPEKLMSMSYDELKSYFKNTQASTTELLNLLSRYGVIPSSSDKNNLIEFSAREISDIGMYKRVSQGN